MITELTHKDMHIIMELLACIILGLISYVLIDNTVIYNVYVIALTIILLYFTFSEKDNIVRPFFFFTLSFFVFVWMRILLNVFGLADIITVGDGISTDNIRSTAIVAGIIMASMTIIAMIFRGYLSSKDFKFFRYDEQLVAFRGKTELLIVGVAILFFSYFLLDSIRKIQVVRTANYLDVSETILVQGYRYFTIGKIFIWIWILLGQSKKRFYVGSTILAVSALGYMMRGARGYAISYFFLWLLFFSFKHKIKFGTLVLIGLGVIFVASAVLDYRMGWTISHGFFKKIIDLLQQQGATIEVVFGALVFRPELQAKWPFGKVLIDSGQFGLAIDQTRGTGFTQGGFGDSFFAEVIFMRFPFNILFIILMGICVGLLEYCYQYDKKCNFDDVGANIMLFMTMPNLIYFGRSNATDFIRKVIEMLIIIYLFAYYMRGRMPADRKINSRSIRKES